ncbi:MAG TPA: aminotransferase class I/II-fold pyridoxal phosphate-dependent enzyme, partial [Paracoccus sp. (in: a-proteobacteria)]|nr:aminotransferase class I/II-fold pyridoxal phosphate-dependent enzyme [Paracoccus sp. (in: a-proteobacteria)]
ALTGRAAELGISVISDEIYHGLDYGAGFHSALEVSDDVVVINSFSKYFSMTGWRVGWMVVPEPMIRTVERIAQNMFICPPHASQVAALAALDCVDEAEANPVRPYIDLGGIKVLPREGLNLRLEVEEQTKRIVAVGLDYAGSSLQVQPFAAPRTRGLWDETRVQLRDQIRSQGGRAEERDGPLGKELLAEVPATAAEGSGMRLARFVGVDGPRWFLRGV